MTVSAMVARAVVDASRGTPRIVNGPYVVVPAGARALLSINDAATFAGVSRRTIYYWIAHKRVETLKLASGARRVFRDSLLQSGQ